MTKADMAAAIEALQRSVVRLQADVERLKNPWAQPYFNMNMFSNMPDGPFPKGRQRDSG